MQNQRAFFLINESNLTEQDKQFLTTHIQVYEDMLRTIEGELSLRQSQLTSIEKDLASFDDNKKRVLCALDNVLVQIKAASIVLAELQKVNNELKEIKESLDNSAKQSLAKTNEQICYFEYKIRKAIELINMIDFPAIRQTI